MLLSGLSTGAADAQAAHDDAGRVYALGMFGMPPAVEIFDTSAGTMSTVPFTPRPSIGTFPRAAWHSLTQRWYVVADITHPAVVTDDPATGDIAASGGCG